MTITGCMVPEVWSVTDRIFCHFGLFFAFTLLTTQKIKILKNCEICWRYYHFTHMYHKWQSYDVWFLRYQVRQPDFLSFWIIFCPFTTQKIKILKKWKTPLEILSFYTSIPKITIICYTVPEIWHMTDLIVIFHFGLFFSLFMCTKNYD